MKTWILDTYKTAKDAVDFHGLQVSLENMASRQIRLCVKQSNFSFQCGPRCRFVFTDMKFEAGKGSRFKPRYSAIVGLTQFVMVYRNTV
jgi:hypothetical protein